MHQRRMFNDDPPVPATRKKSRHGLGWRSAEVLQVFDHYRTFHPRAFRLPDPGSDEWRKIQDRLQEGYTVEDLMLAIDGCHRSAHNLGQNARGKTYLALELIVRNGSKVSQFIDESQASQADRPVLSDRSARSIEAARRFVEGGPDGSR